MTLRSVEGRCKRLMLANVLQLISFLSVLFAATIAVFLGVYRYYITLILWTAVALTLNSAMLLYAHSIKKRLPTTPFAIKLQQSRPDEIVQALGVKPVIPNVYCDFRRNGRTNIRLLVLLENGSEGKNRKKRANTGESSRSLKHSKCFGLLLRSWGAKIRKIARHPKIRCIAVVDESRWF